MKLRQLRIILLPFSIIYAFIVEVRNFLYSKKIIKSYKSYIYTIGIGNISTGGTGKSPLTIFLSQIFSKKCKVAVLSRGYGRKIKGKKEVLLNSAPYECGDEPLMIKKHLPGINVIVAENRVEGIKYIENKFPETKVIILDDAFQHRKVSTHTSIVLISYYDFFKKDFLLPAGNLRETYKELKRADIIIISKCPKNLSDFEMEKIKNKISKWVKNSNIFFSYVRYNKVVPVTQKAKNIDIKEFSNILLVTGIANPYPLKKELELKFNIIKHLKFKDHCKYSSKDINKIIHNYNNIKNCLIFTTFKDKIKLINNSQKNKIEKLPIFAVPVSMEFFNNDKIKLINKLEKDFEKIK